jgi:hypothetical protein
MKKIVLIIASVFVAQLAQASYLESCDFTGTVTELGRFNAPFQSEGKYSKQITLSIEEVKDKGSHGGCDHHIGTEMEMKLLSSDASALASLQLGQTILVDYFFVSGMTPDGIYSNQKTTLVTPAEKVVRAVLANKGVGERMLRLQRDLAFGAEPVVVLALNAQYLPEGHCGFAGCESVYSVTITMGQDYRNSQRETIFVKASTSALGETVEVELIK